MIIYVFIVFIALCVGMAVSVYAFGTGGKRKRIFQDIYFSVEEADGIGVIYTKTGEYSAVLKLENPVQKYCANIDSYYEFTQLFTAIAQTLGEGYAIHKQDIFIRKKFTEESDENREFLSTSYFRYFNGRPYTDSECYLTITQEVKKSRLFSFDGKKWRDFLVKIRKVHDQLRDAGVQVRFLNRQEVNEYVDRYFAMNFRDKVVSMTNFKVDDECISMGDKRCKVYSLVDVDNVSLPSVIRPYTNVEVNNSSMPMDLVSVVSGIPNTEAVVYNQMIFIPNQKRELALLDKKKNRHASMPNPGNQMAVEDIKRVQEVVARESKQLVYTHYNLVVAMSADTDIHKCTNHLENQFSRMGIHISKRAYNQLELFVNSFPGNCYGMNPDYDRFLTLGDAAACLMYKERILHSEKTPLKIYYTDRQGVPVAIDITGKEGAEKLTDNSNFFCLGPSGSGKSFHMEVAFDGEELNPIEFLTMLYGNIQALGKSGHGAAHEFTPFDGEIKTRYDRDKEEIEELILRFLPVYMEDLFRGEYIVPEYTEQSLRNVFTVGAAKNYFFESMPSMANPLGIGSRALPLAGKVQNLLIADFLNYLALRHNVYLSTMSEEVKKNFNPRQ